MNMFNVKLYVDDILLLSNGDDLLNEENKFAIVDQGDFLFILGMSVTMDR